MTETDAQLTPEQLAQRFHETYERLAPEFGYRTREASAKPWAEVPEQNRALMVATAGEVLGPLLDELAIAEKHIEQCNDEVLKAWGEVRVRDARIAEITEERDTVREVARSNKRVTESYAEEVEQLRQKIADMLAIRDDVVEQTGAALVKARAELAEAIRERDLAIAHDRQEYPTQWAYGQAVKTIERMRPVVKRAQQLREDKARRAGNTPEDQHPERICNRCGGPNVHAWTAPSPLWNQVMRGGDINAPDLFGGIVCTVCFAHLAEEAGIAERWRFYAERVHVELGTVTPSGRVWNERKWLWEDVSDVHRPTGFLPIGSPHSESCLVCDEPWPCADAASPETIGRVAVALARRAANPKPATEG